MLLQINRLETHFSTEEGIARAVDKVSLSLDRGEVLGIVGESGSGKSVLALSILRLVPDPPGRIAGGEILFEEEEGKADDLAAASEARLRRIRGNRIAMIFQDPMTALNPYLKIGDQLAEVLEVHKGMKRREAREKCIEMLSACGIAQPSKRIDSYPHELSGGMRQRVLIAMALLCDPALLIADEPTTALDVTIQAQILDLIRERKEALGAAVMLITHDLGVVAKMADRVAVMYAGRIVEEASVDDIFYSPKHPYTIALHRSIPRISDAPERRPLTPIAGMPPSAARIPPGCPYHPRCEQAIEQCKTEEPSPRETGNGKRGLHVVRCHVSAL
ncbi:MAG: ABC transporter ATP-binding protein [Polyangiaceae bacterium]|nr:ABC transporter ATP-binding protein [Polyangiaceae bacterium]